MNASESPGTPCCQHDLMMMMIYIYIYIYSTIINLIDWHYIYYWLLLTRMQIGWIHPSSWGYRFIDIRGEREREREREREIVTSFQWWVGWVNTYLGFVNTSVNRRLSSVGYRFIDTPLSLSFSLSLFLSLSLSLSLYIYIYIKRVQGSERELISSSQWWMGWVNAYMLLYISSVYLLRHFLNFLNLYTTKNAKN